MHVQYEKQQRDYWCGPACARMVLRQGSQAHIARTMRTNRRNGTSRVALVQFLRQAGAELRVHSHGTLAELAAHLPAIVSYQEVEGEDHYAIALRVTKNHVVMHDPWHGPTYKLPRREFVRRWKNPNLRKKYTGWFVAVC